MKYLLTLILFVSFMGITIFGFTFFTHGMNSSDSNCVTSPVNMATCPTSITAMTLHHISSVQTFITSATPTIYNWLLLLAFTLLISVSVFSSYKNLLSSKLETLWRHLRDLANDFSYSKQKIISWLSLFENSPAF